MLETFVTAWPWDLIDPVVAAAEDADAAAETSGLEALLDRLHGGAGVRGVSLWMVTPPVTAWRASRYAQRFVAESGGSLFAPTPDRYRETQCNPLETNWLRERVNAGQLNVTNAWARIANACAERKLALRAIVSATLPGEDEDQHRTYRTRNALGIELLPRLCLNHPQVRAYLGGLLADISDRFSLHSVVLRDFEIRCGAVSPGCGSTPVLSALPPGAKAWPWQVCFCGACEEAARQADVDPEAARQECLQLVDHLATTPLAEPGATSTADLRHDAPLLAEYLETQHDQLVSLWDELAERTHPPLVRQTRGMLASPVDPPAAPPIRAQIDLTNALTGHELDAAGVHIPEAAPSTAATELLLPVWLHADQEGRTLVAATKHAADAGYAAVEFDGVGVLGDGAFDTLRQAVRYAKRVEG
jgi:hypothetical protein